MTTVVARDLRRQRISDAQRADLLDLPVRTDRNDALVGLAILIGILVSLFVARGSRAGPVPLCSIWCDRTRGCRIHELPGRVAENDLTRHFHVQVDGRRRSAPTRSARRHWSERVTRRTDQVVIAYETSRSKLTEMIGEVKEASVQ